MRKDVDERIAEYEKAARERPGLPACSPSSAASLTEPPTSHATSRFSAAWSTSGTKDSASGIYGRESLCFGAPYERAKPRLSNEAAGRAVLPRSGRTAFAR